MRQGQGRRNSKISHRQNLRSSSSPENHSRQIGPHSHAKSKNNQSSNENLSRLVMLGRKMKKKSFLYEKDLSQTVALVAWLVSRDLSLRKGSYYLKDVADAVQFVMSPLTKHGLVTITKINRCLQVILKSSFEYILPKADGGTQECGLDLIKKFEDTLTCTDDEFTTSFLNSLPAPWKDIDFTLATNTERHIEQSKRNNELRGKMEPMTGGGTEKHVKNDSEDKTKAKTNPLKMHLVDNVRSLKSLLINHDERIRDLADDANLNLTHEEWSSYFCVQTDGKSQGRTLPTGSGSNISSFSGEVYFVIPSQVSDALNCKRENRNTSVECPRNMTAMGLADSGPSHSSTLVLEEKGQYCRKVPGSIEGLLDPSEFISTLCCKQYNHDREKCIFTHPVAKAKDTTFYRDPGVQLQKIFDPRKRISGATQSAFDVHLVSLFEKGFGEPIVKTPVVKVSQKLSEGTTFDRAPGAQLQKMFDPVESISGANQSVFDLYFVRMFQEAFGKPIGGTDLDTETPFVNNNLLKYGSSSNLAFRRETPQERPNRQAPPSCIVDHLF